MYKILDEIRDKLQAGVITSHTAAAGTTTTNIKIVGHGLANGDNIINVTRGNALRAITVVDADNFTVATVAAQTSGDNISFLKFKKCYVGKYENPPLNYLPVLMVYPEFTQLTDRLTTATDSYKFRVVIDILTSAFVDAQSAEDNGDLQAQKLLWDLMESRNAQGTPDADSVLGILRRNIRGSNYLYNNDITIEYDDYKIDNKLYYRGRMRLSGITDHALRS